MVVYFLNSDLSFIEVPACVKFFTEEESLSTKVFLI